MKIDSAAATRLEKAAHDNGFDLPSAISGEWLIFKSSHCPLTIWLGLSEAHLFLIAISDPAISKNMVFFGVTAEVELPMGAVSGIVVADLPILYSVLKRIFQLSRALPNEPLNEFQKLTRGLPQSTEIERIVVQRVGQDIFRERLFEFWDGKCAVTGLAIKGLLRASHIKPWSDCATDAERLDVYNGLLLAPHLDAAFDRGFISFGDDGLLIISKHLGHEGLKILGIDLSAKCGSLTVSHSRYMEWHRDKVFQGK